jgi:DNA polymerase elongation subunit (family B)
MRQERAQGHVRVSLVKLVDFYGYQADCKGTYAKVESRSMQLHRQLIYEVKSWPDAALYESNVDPIIRFCHVRDIKPCSWCRVPAAKNSVHAAELPTTCQFEVTTHWSQVSPMSEREDIGRMLVASFDIECSSSHGDFPTAVKTYRQLSAELYAEFLKVAEQPKVVQLSAMRACLETAFGIREDEPVPGVSVLHFKARVRSDRARALINQHLDDVRNILAKMMRVRLDAAQVQNRSKGFGRNDGSQDPVRGVLARQLVPKVVHCGKAEQQRTKDNVLTDLDCKMCHSFPALEGDSIIQIGTTFHRYGDTECCYKHVVTLGTCDPIPGVHVRQCATETEVLLAWSSLIRESDPDVVIGYNINAFDFAYMKDRAGELGASVAQEFSKLGRLKGVQCNFKEANMSSSALGDNTLRYYDMTGRTTVDLMKVVQRDHRLDSYKLDHVAETFLGERKNDVSPGDIFRLQGGTSADRRTVAEYCVQDCALCNRLIIKLETIANSVGMANVCRTPLSYIFRRG